MEKISWKIKRKNMHNNRLLELQEFLKSTRALVKAFPNSNEGELVSQICDDLGGDFEHHMEMIQGRLDLNDNKLNKCQTMTESFQVMVNILIDIQERLQKLEEK